MERECGCCDYACSAELAAVASIQGLAGVLYSLVIVAIPGIGLAC